jgi:TetR/AcrR family transcriptional regulator, transcriptional repressor for nem operon
MTEDIFAAAPYHKAQDPLDRLLGYVDFRAAILSGELPEYTCLLGTLVQETYATHPEIRIACDSEMSSHIAELTRDIEACAFSKLGPRESNNLSRARSWRW